MAHSQPDHAAERQQQQDLKDRRKQERWKRLTLWLSAQEADTLQTLGDEWLGRTVKALLAEAIGGHEHTPILEPGASGDALPAPGAALLESRLAAAVLAERGRTIALLFRIGISAVDIAALLHLKRSEVARVLGPVPDAFTLTRAPTSLEDPQDQEDLMQDVDNLLAHGLSGTEIAWQFNAAGRRAAGGTEFSGANLIRDWRRWKRRAI